MSKTGFILTVVIIYIIYYVGNIIYDIFFKKKNIVESNLNKNALDVSDLIEDEFTSTIDVVLDEETADDVFDNEIEENDSIDVEDNYDNFESSLDIETDAVFDNSEIANVTHHGGYTVTELKSIFSEISDGGTNPFLSVTAKMIY